MKDYITTFTFTTYFINLRKWTTIWRYTVMVTQETMSCPEAVVIYFVSITYKKSIANQLLSIAANFVSSRNGKERCVIAQNGCMGINSLRA